MKKILYVFILAVLFSGVKVSAQELSPYYKLADFTEDVETISTKVKTTLQNDGWDIIGEYNPARNENLKVICFTNQKLKSLSLEFKDRGALASVLKAAMVYHGDTTTLSLLNPEYMFLAYWGEQLNGQEGQLKAMSDEVVDLFSEFGKPSPFGGWVEKKDLPDYHYMMMMPYFNEPVDLKQYNSFNEGLEFIRGSLESNAGQTIKVYEQLFEDSEIAVFGVGLWTAEIGESHFLPIIGENNIANLPYEIILQGTEATMLHGKYRIAIFWPELKMGQFMKISSTPGDIEDIMEDICNFD